MNDNDPKIIGEPAGWTPETEADHYCVCLGCVALIDTRDLGVALQHAGELPHRPGIKRS